MADNLLPLLTDTMKTRFWAKVEKTECCWVWTAAKDPRGYGRISCQIGGRTVPVPAHRLSLYLVGRIPSEGQLALHSCDNPSCVRPDHLRWGTAKDNSQDMVKRGRTTPTETHRATMRACAKRGSSHHFYKFSPEVVAKIFVDRRSHAIIAKAYGVSQGYVSLVKAGKTRSEVTAELLR